MTINDGLFNQQLENLRKSFKSGDYQKAIIQSVRINERVYNYLEAWMILGASHMALNNFHDAVLAFKHACELSPSNAEVFSNLGAAYKNGGDPYNAKLCYKKSLILSPGHLPARYNLSVILYDLGYFRRSKIEIEKVLSQNPNHSDALQLLGMVCEALGKTRQAKNAYDQALKINPTHKAALISRWKLLFTASKYTEALKDSDAALKIGESRSLATLYALDRYDEILTRIKVYEKSDPYNMNIAAFVAFFESTTNHLTGYNFLDNPFNYIYTDNIYNKCQESGTTIVEIIDDLMKVKAVESPTKNTTVGGFQSPQGLNILQTKTISLIALRKIIVSEVKSYYKKYKSENYKFISDWPEAARLFGWHVILKQGGHQSLHNHPSGWLSGVIYLKVVPDLGKDEGAIEFSLDSPFFSSDETERRVIRPVEGDIVLFPSSLHHRTIPFTSDEKRIIVSFDLIPVVSKN